MTLQETLALLRYCVESPLWFGPATDAPDVGVKIDETARCAGWWSGGDKAIDVVLRVGCFLVAVDIVVAGLAQGSRLVDSVNKMNPVKVALPLPVAAQAVPLVIEVSLGRGKLLGCDKLRHIMAAKAQIEIRRAPGGGTGKSVYVICAPDAAVGRTVWSHRC